MAELVVAGVGPVGWDAGTDLFLDVVRHMGPPDGWRPVWIGRRSCGASRRADVDARLLGLEDVLEWREGSSMAGVDVAVVTARTPSVVGDLVDEVPSGVPVLTWGAAGPDGDGAEYPDTVRLAACIRDVLVAAGRGGAP